MGAMYDALDRAMSPSTNDEGGPSIRCDLCNADDGEMTQCIVGENDLYVCGDCLGAETHCPACRRKAPMSEFSGGGGGCERCANDVDRRIV